MPNKGYIPTTDGEFNAWQVNFVGRIVATPAAYGVTPAQVTELQALQADWTTDYPAHIAAQNAAQAAAESKDESRSGFESGIRSLTRQIQARPETTGAQREELDITVPDTEPTPRGKINVIPYVFLKPLGGGDVEVRSQTEDDPTRVSMHPLADGIECRYVLVPVGEMPPDDPESTLKTLVSKKARFIINCGAKNAGQKFYGFFRWANQSIPANSGPWSQPMPVVVA